MDRLLAWKTYIVACLGCWLILVLAYLGVPSGLAVGAPFVLVYAWWNFPAWRDRVRLNRDIRNFEKGNRGNTASVRRGH